MNAHIFQPTAGSKSPCTVCGKTRNTKAHKEALTAQVESDVAMEAEMDVEAETLGNQVDEAAIAAAREDMLPEADASTDDGEIADALAALEEQEAAKVKAAKKAPAKGRGAPTASIWVGWRITNAAVLSKTSLAKKLQDAKPTGDLDRTVKLTAEELATLDAVAAKFMEPGHTGPEIYSGRALRGRIAAALAKLQ